MGLLKLLQVCVHLVLVIVVHILESADSTVLIRFHRTPSARSRFSTAVFRYWIIRPDGSIACKKNDGCSIYCEVDGQILRPCPVGLIVLRNMTVNRGHSLLLNVTTLDGERNSSVYKWFIDTIPPTATIVSERNYANAEKIAIHITFSEPCSGWGGFKCLNSSICDVLVNGPAHVDASSLQVVKPNIKYSLLIALSLRSISGRIVIKMAQNFCTDQAGNHFMRTNGSIIIVHFDRSPVQANLWTSVPPSIFEINGIPRTVLATNKMEDLQIFLDFSAPIANSTEEILNVLHVNSGDLVPVHSKSHSQRQFVFELKHLSRTEIITVKLQPGSVIGRSGTLVSSVTPMTFLYDSTKPVVELRTTTPGTTKESNINVIAEFTEPVFGFEASTIEVQGGRLIRSEERSKTLYMFTILVVSQNAVSVFIPEDKAHDVSGNQNFASKRLEIKQYSTPSISVALHSFVTAGILATSLAAALLSLSSANLDAIGTLTSGTANNVICNPSMNLQGMVGHLQVFVLSDWISIGLPVEYSETARGLRWLIPREKIPWKKGSTSASSNHEFRGPHKLSTECRSSCIGLPPYERKAHYPIDLNSRNFSSQHGLLPKSGPKVGQHHGRLNLSMKNIYGLPLNSREYFIYLLGGEPLSAVNVIKKIENFTGANPALQIHESTIAETQCLIGTCNKCKRVVPLRRSSTPSKASSRSPSRVKPTRQWQDLEMNLFWLGIGSGSFLLARFIILLFLRWRTGTSVHGILSVPRFELYLLILMLPCISQSAAFVIRGGTTGGIITGTLLLAIPAALILFVGLFLIISIFMGNFVHYSEISHVNIRQQWYTKLMDFLVGRPTTGRWFYRDGLTSSFLSRFGLLFEDRKGPPDILLVAQNEPHGISKWIDSDQSGIGRMRPVRSDDSNEETKVPMSNRILGCARSSYIILDLLRRVGLGIISGAHISHGHTESILASAITVVQLVYLFTLKPYIRRGVQCVESLSLLCEASIFGISSFINYSNPLERRAMGFVMLALFFISFVSQLVNEWYALIKCLLKLSNQKNPSFKIGMKCVAKGILLPFLPRKHWSKFISVSSKPNTGQVSVLPLSSETESKREDTGPLHVDPLIAMTATAIPELSPRSANHTHIHMTSLMTGSRSHKEERAGDRKQLNGVKLEPKSDLKKLRELAKASFSRVSTSEEGTCSYAQ